MKLTHLIAAFALAALTLGSSFVRADIIPASNTVTNSPVSVSFTLPVVALPGSLLLTFDDGVTEHVLTLAGGVETLGLHEFAFDPTTPTATAEISSGGIVPDGVYTVSLAFQDLLSNPIIVGTSTNVTVDTTEPVINSPSGVTVEATSASGAVVNFSVTATDALDASPTLSVIPPSGSVFPIGSTQVVILSTDDAGNEATANFNVIVQDTLSPSIAAPPGGFTPVVFSVNQGETMAIPNYTSQAVVSDDTGTPTVTQVPAPGSQVGDGITSVILTAEDAEGNTMSLNFNIAVWVTGTRALAVKGEAVPGAGVDPRIPAGATWSTFGIPSITMQGNWAGYLATVRPPTGAAFSGIFSGPLQEPALRLKTGEVATDVNGAAIPGVTFKTFREPLFADNDFAVVATVTGVASATDTGIWYHDGAVLRVIAREGDLAPGAGGAKFKSFTSVSMPEAGVVFFTAKVSSPAPLDTGMWIWTSNNGVLIAVRKGDEVDVGSGSLDPNDTAINLLINFADKGAGQATVAEDGSIVTRLLTGVVSAEGLSVSKSGLPSSPEPGALPTALVTFAVDAALGITKTTNTGVFDYNESVVLALKGEVATGAGTAAFKVFQNPATGYNFETQRQAAFLATLSGTPGAMDTGVWIYTAGGDLELLAREGFPAPDATGLSWLGLNWKKFEKLKVIENRGPAFIGTLSSTSFVKVTAANDRGFWATDSNGNLRLIFREGDVVNGKTIKSFNLLGEVLGSEGQRRSWAKDDMSARVIYHVFFTDGTSGILSSGIP